MQDLFDLTDRVAIVTGSSRGIGRAIAEALAARGARVAISSRKAEACEATAAAVRAAGGRAIACACNVSDDAQLRALVDRTVAEWGRVDVLVCNAAVNPHFGPLHEIEDRAWAKIMGANVKGALRLAGLVLPGMAERREGSVILVSSIGGLKGTADIGAYAISKAALMQLARNLAVEWGHANVRVNCIAPGLVRTDFARALWEDPQRRARAERGYPLRRLGEPEDVAGAAVFLAAPAGRFVTGQVLVVDGGATIASGYS